MRIKPSKAFRDKPESQRIAKRFIGISTTARILRAVVLVWICIAPLAVIADQATLLSEAEIVALSDDGVELARRGEWDAAYKALSDANDATFASDAFPDLIKHYPNLAFARYHSLRRDWREVARFSASVASALDKGETREHPYRIEALALYGAALYKEDRVNEALAILRGAYPASAPLPEIRALSGYYLARILLEQDSLQADAVLQEFFDTYDEKGPISPADAIHLGFLNVERAERLDLPITDQITAARQIVKLSDETEGVHPLLRSYYKGHLAKLLNTAGEYAEELTLLRERHAFLRERDSQGTDYFVTVQRMVISVAWAESREKAYGFLQNEIAFARQNEASDEALSVLLTQMGYLAEAIELPQDAQSHFREAYAQARRSLRLSDPIVVQLSTLIDTSDPGFASFDLAQELRSGAVQGLTLLPDGADVLRLFFEGNYRDAERYLAEMVDDSPLFLVNHALHFALSGDYAKAMETLGKARTAARKTTGSEVAPNAPIFDLIEVIADIWGTEYRTEEALGPLARLKVREAGLSSAERSVALALRAFQKTQSGQILGLRDLLADWIDAYDPQATKSVWDIFATGIVMEMVYTDADPDQAEALYVNALQDLDAFPELSLSHDYLVLARMLNAPTSQFDADAVTELARLVNGIADQVPPSHNFLATTQLAMSRVQATRGEVEEAIKWSARSVETWSKSPFHRRDTTAYLLSYQAELMSLTRDSVRVAQAATLAKQAFEMVDPLNDRPDLVSGILRSYALSAWARAGRPGKAVEILTPLLDDPRFMVRMNAANRVDMLLLLASAMPRYDDPDALIAVLDRAAAEIPKDDKADWRPLRAQVSQLRATAYSAAGRSRDAFAAMATSNDIYFGWRDDVMSGDSAAYNVGEIRSRASWEAFVGWDYAQQLPD